MDQVGSTPALGVVVTIPGRLGHIEVQDFTRVWRPTVRHVDGRRIAYVTIRHTIDRPIPLNHIITEMAEQDVIVGVACQKIIAEGSRRRAVGCLDGRAMVQKLNAASDRSARVRLPVIRDVGVSIVRIGLGIVRSHLVQPPFDQGPVSRTQRVGVAPDCGVVADQGIVPGPAVHDVVDRRIRYGIDGGRTQLVRPARYVVPADHIIAA